MSLSARWINKEQSDTPRWISLGKGSSCYLLVKGKSKRFVGKTNIGSFDGKQYKVYLGYWIKDFTSSDDVLQKWSEMKTWGLENNSDVRRYAERLTLKKTDTTLKEVFCLYLQYKSQHIKTIKTYKSRLDQILLKLPEGIMIDDFAGHQGRNFIKERVCDPRIAKGNVYIAKRHRRDLNQAFQFAMDELSLPPEILPYLHLRRSPEKQLRNLLSLNLQLEHQ